MPERETGGGALINVDRVFSHFDCQTLYIHTHTHTQDYVPRICYAHNYSHLVLTLVSRILTPFPLDITLFSYVPTRLFILSYLFFSWHIAAGGNSYGIIGGTSTISAAGMILNCSSTAIGGSGGQGR